MIQTNFKQLTLTLTTFVFLVSLITVPNVYAWYSGYSNWQYRKAITITEQGGNTLTNYQVKLTIDTASLISEGKMKSDCSDMRFTDENDNPIPYWIESGCNSANTIVWVKVPEIPASSTSTIYMYYGNPLATSESNGDAVFLFFDDFDGTSLDTNKWTLLHGAYNIHDSLLSNGASSDWLQITTKDTFSRNIIINVKSRAVNNIVYGYFINFMTSGNLRNTADENGYEFDYDMYAHDTGKNKMFGLYKETGTQWTELATKDENYDYNFHVYKIIVADTIEVYQDNILKLQSSDSTYTSGHIDLGSWNQNPSSQDNYEYDYIFVRKYASSEPTYSIGAEETSQLPEAYLTKVYEVHDRYSTAHDFAESECCYGDYCYVVGYSFDEGDGDTSGDSVVVWKINKEDGQVVNTLRFEAYDNSADDDTDVGLDCSILNNYLYVVGFTNSYGSYGGFVAKIDLSTFTKTDEWYYDYSSGYDKLVGITTDGTYLYIYGEDGDSDSFLARKISPTDGSILATYTKALDDLPCRTGTSIRSPYATSIVFMDNYLYFDGRYYCKGDWDGDGYVDDHDFRVVVVKLDTDLNEQKVFTKDFYIQNFENTQDERLLGMTEANGNLAVTYHYYDGSSHHNGFLVLDSNLNEISQKDFDDNGIRKIYYYSGYYFLFGSNLYYSVYDNNLNFVVSDTLNSFESIVSEFGKFYMEKNNIYLPMYDYYTSSDYDVSFYQLKIQFSNRPPQITIYSPTNTTYFTTNILANFTVTDDNSTSFPVKAYLDDQLIYDNSNYVNNTQITLNLTPYITQDKQYNFTVWANDNDETSPQISTQTIIFTVNDYETVNVIYNPTVHETTNQNFTIVFHYNPGLIKNITSMLIWNGTNEGYETSQLVNTTHISNTKTLTIPHLVQNNTNVQFYISNKIEYLNGTTTIVNTTIYDQTLLFNIHGTVVFTNYTTYNGKNYAQNLVIWFNVSEIEPTNTNFTVKLYDNNTVFYVSNASTTQIANSYTYNPGTDEVSQINVTYAYGPRETTIGSFDVVFLYTILFSQYLQYEFGFYATPPQSQYNFTIIHSLAPYVNCSLPGGYNVTFNESDYLKNFTYNVTLEHYPISFNFTCWDFYNVNATTYEYPIYLIKITPVDEETGQYNTSLWVDAATNDTALIRFTATSDLFNQSLIWENISKTVWLLIPTKKWILRVETLYTNNYLASNMYLRDYPYNTLDVCIPENKPENLQTAFTSTPIDVSFVVKRADTGCVKSISTATDSIGNYWGFYFYTLPALYTLSKYEDGKEIFITALRGEAENMVDLQKILYQFQKVAGKYIGTNIIKVEKGENSTIIYFNSPYKDTYTLHIYDENNVQLYEQKIGQNSTTIVLWKSLGINESTKIKIEITDSNNDVVATWTGLASGKEIKYSAYFTGVILLFVLTLLFLKPLNLEKIFVLTPVILFIVFYFVPKTEPNTYIYILSVAAVVAAITEGIIVWKMVK